MVSIKSKIFIWIKHDEVYVWNWRCLIKPYGVTRSTCNSANFEHSVNFEFSMQAKN